MQPASPFRSVTALLLSALLVLVPAGRLFAQGQDRAQDNGIVKDNGTGEDNGTGKDNGIVKDGRVTLSLRDVELSAVMEMLSRAAHTNILLSDDISAKVSVNLYAVRVDQAIRSIASSAGFGVEYRSGSYFIVPRDKAGKSDPGGPTRVRTFKVQYSDPEVVAGIIRTHLSTYGQVTALPARRLLIVQDTPQFLDEIQKLLRQLDRQPRQILIEAKILEVTLTDSESYGLDWGRVFNSGKATIGTQGLGNPASPGLFFNYITPNVQVFLDSLRSSGRTRTLSTPKLLAMEDQQAETIIGNRLGYNVTTTIDNVTRTSVEFLESGVIMKVKPSVDGQGRILLEIHPEVSKGNIQNGLPTLSTTEVTTTMLVESGQTVFIGGLITRSQNKNRDGVPVLSDIPGLGRLFANKGIHSENSEIVVLVTPYLIDNETTLLDDGKSAGVNAVAQQLEQQPRRINHAMDKVQYLEDTFEKLPSPFR
jgi:type II secretory pathway component GspD/PulD (secretin)